MSTEDEMSRTASEMVALGTAAPAFELVDVLSGRTLSRDDVFASAWNGNAAYGNRNPSNPAPSATRGGPHRKHGLLLMFVCVHCPYVKHLEAGLARLGQEYAGPEGPLAIAAIQSNDIAAYPEDNADKMREQAIRLGWNFPYLLDETQEVARSYGAACTPDFFLFDNEMKLVYRGQFDGSRPPRGDFGNDEPVTGIDLRRAVDAIIAGQVPDPNQRASIGCNIKWKQD